MHNEIKTYPISPDPKKQKDFLIKEMGTLYDLTEGKPDKPHRHNYYTVIHTEKASGYHYVDFNRYPLDSNCLFFIYPGQVHQVIADSKPRGTVLNFTNDFLIRNGISDRMVSDIYLYNDYGESPPLMLDANQNKSISTILEQMKMLIQRDLIYVSEGLGALLKLLFIESIQLCNFDMHRDTQTLETGNHLIRKFKKLLGAYFSTKHKVSDFAELLSVSPDYLNKTIKVISGKSAKELIQHKLILEAKRILLFSDASNKEISFQLGFEEPAHFNNFFKRQTGITPATFREQARKN